MSSSNVRQLRWWSSSTAATAGVVDGGGKGRGARWTQARADEGARARARPARARGRGRTRARGRGQWLTFGMADDNGKQQKRASDDGAARRRSSKINEIGVTYLQYLFFDVGVCLCVRTRNQKKSGSRVTQLKIADASMPHQKLVPVRIRGVPICECAGIQKNSHMGSPRTHNEIVRIWGLTWVSSITSLTNQNRTH